MSSHQRLKFLLTLKAIDPTSTQIIQDLISNLLNSGNFLCSKYILIYNRYCIQAIPEDR